MTTHYLVVVALHRVAVAVAQPLVVVARHLVLVVAPQPAVVAAALHRVAVVVSRRAVVPHLMAAELEAQEEQRGREVLAPETAAGAAAAHLVAREPAPPRQHRKPAHHRRCRRVRRESLLDLWQVADKYHR